MPRLPPESRAFLLKRLAARAERLAKVASLGAPDVVLAIMAEHALKTAMAVCGPELAREWSTWLAGQIDEYHGLCRFCQKPKAVAEPMCPTCLEEMEQMDRDVLLDAADETHQH